jgi:parvulin-like peptidyl-prolyl isomerase
MRNSAKIVFFLVLVAFAGFMVLQGLISIFSDPTQGGRVAPQGVIGIVNGEEIPIAAFENLYRPEAQALFQEEDEPTEDELQRIRDEVWNRLTTLTNLRIEAARHGVFVTDAEVAEYMKLTPPQDLLTVPDFQTEGQFDMGKYQAWLRQVAGSNNPELVYFLRNFENQMRQQILLSRLQNLIGSMVRITATEAREDFIKKNEKSKVRFLLISQGDYTEEEIVIPETDILAKYEADKEQFKRPEQAVVSYISIPRGPGDADYNEVKGLIDSLYNLAITGEDFAELAKSHSEDPGSGEKGGDLDWFGEGKMVEPFWQATTSLNEIGDISAPFKTGFGWHIVKLTGRRDAPNINPNNPGSNVEYRASHILIKVEMSNTTLAQLQAKADNFIKDALANGFAEAAEDFGLLVTQTDPFTNGAFNPNFPTRDLSQFAFSAEPGEISEVITTRSDFMVALLDQINPESYSPLEEVRERLTATLKREKRIDMAYDYGLTLYETIKNGGTLNDIAENSEKTVLETEYFARHDFIKNGPGSDAAFIGAALRLSPENRYSPPVRSTSGAYIIEFIDFQPADTLQFTAKADSLTQDLRNTKRQEAWSKWVNTLMQEAQIEDYRSFYYGS